MSHKKTTANETTGQYVRTFRDGAVAANVFRNTSTQGEAYLTFELSRSWKLADGSKEGYSRKFFARNGDAVANVVTQAVQWIDEQPNKKGVRSHI